MEDNKGRIDYYCRYCEYKTRKIEKIKNHLAKCIEAISNLTYGIDFVFCKICNFHSQNLGIHLRKIHNISTNQYIINYDGYVLSEKSHKKYKTNGYKSIESLQKFKDNCGDNYSIIIADAVRKAIMENPEERERRSVMMTNLNNVQQQDPEFQRLVSETAKKTSARPEIQAARSANLKKWRDENPDEFFDKCISKMVGAYQSKPEAKLFEFVSSLPNFSFKRNQFVHSINITNASNKKQIDMADKNKRIYVEFDGIMHFEDIFGIDALNRSRLKDKEIECHILKHKWTMIRISYDQYKYSTKTVSGIKSNTSYFLPECLKKLVELLNNNIPGVYKIGNTYE